MPNALIAGVGKSGTTSLFWYLSQHPEICASDVKEVNYFSAARDYAPLPPIETYISHWSHWQGEPYRLEASPSYFYGGDPVIAAVAAQLGRPHIIISLREPVTRLWSAYTFLKSMGQLDAAQTFRGYVAECRAQLESADARQPTRTTPLAVGFYWRYLRPWFEAFGDRVAVVFADDIFEQPAVVVDRLCERFDVDRTTARTFQYNQHNQTIVPRIHRLATLAYRGQALSDRLLRQRPQARAALRAAYAAVNRRPRPSEQLEPELRRELTALYRPANAQLARELATRGYEHEDLPAWLRAA